MKYALKETKKRKLEKAEIMLTRARQQTSMQQSNAYVTNQSSQVLAASCGETLSITGGKKPFGSFSLSANKKKKVFGRSIFH